MRQKQQENSHHPGLMERWAERMVEADIKRLERSGSGARRPRDAFWTLHLATAGAFAAGFICSGFLAIAEIWYFANPLAWHDEYPLHTALFIAAALLCTGLEFWLLFRLGFRAAAQLVLAAANDLHLRDPHDRQAVIRGLCRAVLEIPEPDLRPFDLNPAKYVSRANQTLLFVLYRLKILLSNFIAKLVLRRLLPRVGLRGYAPLVAAPITGLWNAWVMWLVLREARFRIMGRLEAEAILARVQNMPKPSATFCEALLMLIGNRITLYGAYNQQLDYLLSRLHEDFAGTLAATPVLDDWGLFRECFARLDTAEKNLLLAIAALLFAGKRARLSRMEHVRLDDLGLSLETIGTLKQRFARLDVQAGERVLASTDDA